MQKTLGRPVRLRSKLTMTSQGAPVHLRELASRLPQAAGVYFFYGSSTLPLYIGKSINIRTRVLSHLREPSEARMLKQTERFDYQLTAGEMGALLLEAQLIKQCQPLYNHKLRRNRQLCAWRLTGEQTLELVQASTVDFAQTPHLYGLYASRHSAENGLRNLANEHQLCHVALGLEKPTGHRGCFRFMLKQCRGVCCGHESPAQHAQRLFDALQVLTIQTWPYNGPIALHEKAVRPVPDQPRQQLHVVHNWCYLGSAPTKKAAHALAKVESGFDADSYQILCKPILMSQMPIIELDATSIERSPGR
jgi:excinuclease Cho